MVDLVAEEELQVLPESRLLVQVGHAGPLFITEAVVPE